MTPCLPCPHVPFAVASRPLSTWWRRGLQSLPSDNLESRPCAFTHFCLDDTNESFPCLFPIIHVNMKEKKTMKILKYFSHYISVVLYIPALKLVFSTTVLIVSSCCSICAHLYFPKAALLKHKKISWNLLKHRF